MTMQYEQLKEQRTKHRHELCYDADHSGVCCSKNHAAQHAAGVSVQPMLRISQQLEARFDRLQELHGCMQPCIAVRPDP
jgi:hypothetical protein